MTKKALLSLSIFTSSLLAHNSNELFELSLEDLMNIEITTASKYSEKASASPANIYVFSKDRISQRGYQTVEDILQSLPSVDVQKFSRSPGYGDVTFRGAHGNNKFLILLNGVRISSPAGSIISIGHNFPVFHAKQVEVIMGAASVMYGADAFMGVVNIITEQKKNLLELQTMVSTDNYLQSYANLSKTFDNGLHLNAFISGYHSQDLTFDKDFPELYPNTDLYPNIDDYYAFSPSKSLTFFTSISNENYEVGINYFEQKDSLNFVVTPDHSAFDEESQDNNSITTIYTKLKFDISSNLDSVTTLMYSRLEKDKDTFFENSFTNYQHGYQYARTDRYSLNQDFLYQLGEKHQLSFGFAYDYFNIIPRGPDLKFPYKTSSSSTQQNQTYINTDIPIDFHEYSYTNFGAYLQDNYKMNAQTRLVLGLRYDANSFYKDTINPKATLIYNLGDKHLFKLMYSKAFLAPASDQSYNGYGNLTGDTNSDGLYESYFYHIQNTDLKPETQQTVELNYEYFIDSNTHLKLSSYYTKIQDVILQEYNGGANDTTSMNGAIIYNTQRFENVGTSTIYGLDASFDATVNTSTFIFKNWLNLSFTDATTKQGLITSQTPQVAKYKLKAGSTIICNHNFYITPKLYWIGETTTAVAQNSLSTNSNKKTIPSYMLVDLNLQYKLKDNLILKADIYNLLDNKYFNASFTVNENTSYLTAPQAGRVITAGLLYKF